MTRSPRWMIYGANGFTGRLIAHEARRRGLTPVLAGRSRAALEALAGPPGAGGAEIRVFDLESPREVARNVEDMALVLHCAGPFSRTQPPMLAACLRARTHYLDITGEYRVLEALHWRGPEATRAGITAVSGVGFDVVPTDGVAAHLAGALPTATRLRLAFVGGAVSRGTALTMLEGAGEGGVSRQGGLLVREPAAARTWRVTHDGRSFAAVSVPWGDVATAYHSTGIPTVETYLALSPAAALTMRLSGLAAPLLRLPGVRRGLEGRARRAPGPTPDQMERRRTVVWGEVTDPAGRRRTATLTGPEAYRFTVLSALAAVQRVLAGDVAAGAWTPSQAFGAGFVTTLPGVELNLDPSP